MALRNSHGSRFDFHWGQPSEGEGGGVAATHPGPEPPSAPKQVLQTIQEMASARPYMALAVALGLGVTLGWLIKRR